MKTKEMIQVEDFCKHHHIELTFVQSLNKSGLVDLIYMEEKIFLPLDQLTLLEKFVRLYEMDINVEGIEAINFLLQRIEVMQKEIAHLSERLKLYEKNS